jgi:hypothetical protein
LAKADLRRDAYRHRRERRLSTEQKNTVGDDGSPQNKRTPSGTTALHGTKEHRRGRRLSTEQKNTVGDDGSPENARHKPLPWRAAVSAVLAS